ncbi:MAG TPA: hypothetical protein VK797_03290 [Tepidisphaeraceae bacterium]|nr:hypothetical protein [Tepidisphaeraceae bacterium]
MRHRLFAAASAISLLLCVAVVAAWFFLPYAKGTKFYSSHHCYEITSFTRAWGIDVWGGVRTPDGGLRAAPGKQWDTAWAYPMYQLPLGFSYGKSPADDPTAAGYFSLLIPSWSLIVLFLLLPCAWLYRWWVHPIRLPGQCRRCGYDLTGNTSGVCSECGTSLPLKGAAA